MEGLIMDTATRAPTTSTPARRPAHGPTNDDRPERSVVAAGLLLSLSGIVMLMGFITGEILYPRAFSTSTNTISDLGGTIPPNSVMLQPSRGIFIATVLVAGLAILGADVLLRRVVGHRAFLFALAAMGVGVAGVGVFPGNTAIHPLFALLAFVGGAAAAISSRHLVAQPLRSVFVAIGIVALTCTFAGLENFADLWPQSALGDGGVERWIAYPVILWLVSFGGYLVGATRGLQARR